MIFKNIFIFLILFLSLSCSSDQYHQVYRTSGEVDSDEQDTSELDSRKKDVYVESIKSENSEDEEKIDQKTPSEDEEKIDQKTSSEDEETKDNETPPADNDNTNEAEAPLERMGEVDSNSQVEYIASSVAYSCGDELGRGEFTIEIPDSVEKGDLLVLFLHRTDAPFYPNQDAISNGGLPLVGGPDMSWNKEASCYMQVNGKPCTEKWKHQDLIQSVYWKVFDDGDDMSLTINMPAHKKSKPHETPEWATLAVLRNIDQDKPIYGTATRSPDADGRTIFPQVKVMERGYLLLSQSFDDTVTKNKFQAPDKTESLAYITGDKDRYGCANDETGFLFGRRTETTNQGKEYITNGEGTYPDRDIMISISIKPKD